MVMKVAIIQQDIAWGDPESNLCRLEESMARVPGAELYVFPEMFTTGFATQDDAKLDEDPQRTLDWMKRKAAEGDCALAGSIAMEEDGKCFNRLYFVKPDGETVKYDKRHLFSYGGENRRFTHGRERVITEYRGIRFLLTVCYDIRFPAWDRNRGDYDVQICVANWPTARQLAWETLTVARAIENQTYVIAVNRVGSDPVCEYMGGSKIINPFGEEVVRCGDEASDEAVGNINLRFLQEYNKTFPVLADADRFELL